MATLEAKPADLNMPNGPGAPCVPIERHELVRCPSSCKAPAPCRDCGGARFVRVDPLLCPVFVPGGKK